MDEICLLFVFVFLFKKVKLRFFKNFFSIKPEWSINHNNKYVSSLLVSDGWTQMWCFFSQSDRAAGRKCHFEDFALWMGKQHLRERGVCVKLHALTLGHSVNYKFGISTLFVVKSAVSPEQPEVREGHGGSLKDSMDEDGWPSCAFRKHLFCRFKLNWTIMLVQHKIVHICSVFVTLWLSDSESENLVDKNDTETRTIWNMSKWI